MTLNLLTRPKKKAEAVQNFHDQHGPMDGWSGDDFEHLLDLLVVVNTPGQLARLRLRLTLLAWTGAAMPFYALGELLWAAQNRVSQRLNAVMDRLDDRCSNIESACKRAGDHALVERVGIAFEWISTVANSVGRTAARFVRG
ncbi:MULTISPECIES: hypothetical protein [Streptomyces]|uniref:hypothetical protein n=1 Tax=Streptomyces TaxID=1883 RepID=UPI00073DFC8E|nr:hypothetical protein [Streptomyces sp. FBKL.4005]OYP10257.1 hypothetical protein CFC35_41430 [Streptomyces sp. FBKL.4005]CUW33422.1 hypothetical protein TUE45_pSRTUE45a_0054 [Streptomyces reticuli]